MTHNSTLDSPANFPNGQRLAWILENYAGGVNSNESAQALQIAMWDIVHNGGDGLGMGSIQMAPGAVRDAAEAIILASAGRSSLNATVFRNFDLGTGSPVQTLIGAPVPEPSGMVLLGLGFAGIGMIKRLRKQ